MEAFRVYLEEYDIEEGNFRPIHWSDKFFAYAVGDLVKVVRWSLKRFPGQTYSLRHEDEDSAPRYGAPNYCWGFSTGDC